MTRFLRVVTCLNATGVNQDTNHEASLARQSFK
jgi:hypothetical protein